MAQIPPLILISSYTLMLLVVLSVQMQPLVVSPRPYTWNLLSSSLSPDRLPVTLIGPKQQAINHVQ